MAKQKYPCKSYKGQMAEAQHIPEQESVLLSEDSFEVKRLVTETCKICGEQLDQYIKTLDYSLGLYLPEDVPIVGLDLEED